MEVLPIAFAIVKETARRFKEEGELKATATMMDKHLAAKNQHVVIDGENVTWNNEWEAAGNLIKWEMLHYDVQLIGGIVLHQGKVAEMATGEGKTLVATLPAFLNALAGRGVHVVTVNDYLARRDAEWMAPLFQFHGLSVECIDNYPSSSDARRTAYKADVIYGTNNEFGFDYLRDNMAHTPEELVQGKHHFAMVDEVDSVLIDEARTPLIISGPVPKDSGQQEYTELKPQIYKLVDKQKKLVTKLLQEAKKLIKEENNKEGGLALFRAYRGLPKYKPLIKFLSETGIRQILQKTENYYLAENQKYMPEADKPLFFTIDEQQNQIDLTEKGIEELTGDNEDPSFFIMSDIAEEMSRIEGDTTLSEVDMNNQKNEAIQQYTVKSQRIHALNQLLKAYALFEKDTEYVVIDGKVKIVDEQTGRIMEGRRYSDGLHQAIEAKENVKVEDATQTYATVTLQNYFRMYHKLAGMTGTAETEAGEFWEIYKLDVVVIPTNRPILRDDRNDKVFRTVRGKFNAVVEEIVALTEAGRPVLVGTTSVEISEVVSRMLNMRKIKHQVLNAKQHAKEADVVAEAGKPGTVTIATNMAGRGTDIKLTPESKEAGGLAILGTERHESRRVDRQLRGRSGRQGDPGSSQFFVSLEDNLMRMFIPPKIARVMDRFGYKEEDVIEHKMVTNSIERAQKKVEENNFSIRKRLLEYDDVMNQQREVIYTRRRHALFGERLQLDIMNMLYEVAEQETQSAKDGESLESFRLSLLGSLGLDFPIDEDEFKRTDTATLTQQVYEAAYEAYRNHKQGLAAKAYPVLKNIQEERGATMEDVLIPFSDGKKQLGIVTNLNKAVETEGKDMVLSLEKRSVLANIDQSWTDHLRNMDDIKEQAQNARYEQKDPIVQYKLMAFDAFKEFLGELNDDVVNFLMRAQLPDVEPNQVREVRNRSQRKLREQKDESRSLLSGEGGGSGANRPPAAKPEPVKVEQKVGRNDKVSVQYNDGRVLKGVKFKTVEADLRNNLCVLID